MNPIVLRNARRPGDDSVLDVVIEDGVVSSIGPAGSGGSPSPGEAVDADGRFVLPGLWDEHVHATTWALGTKRIDLSGAETAAQAADIVRDRAGGSDTAAPGDLLVGVGFRDAVWPDLPTIAALDEASRGRPAALVSHDLHCVWINSAAARLFDVAVGSDGLLREEAAFRVTQELSALPNSLVDEWVVEASIAAAARGVVGFVDFEMAWNVDGWLRRVARGFDAVRVDIGVYAHDTERAIGEGLSTGALVSEASAGILRIGPLKLLIDGSLNTRTAYCVDAYPHGGRGVLTVPEDELVAMLTRARDAGFVPAVHAIGDAANRIALDAFERVGVSGRIEHAQFLREGDVARFAALDVTASVQPEHALDDRDTAEFNWPGRTGRAFPLRELLDAGARLALGSDAPVAPLDPWIAMSAATARARDDGRPPWHPEHAITRSEALVASSRGRRAVAAGDVADLVLVDVDPLSAPDDVFRAMPVSATLLGGRFTYRSTSL